MIKKKQQFIVQASAHVCRRNTIKAEIYENIEKESQTYKIAQYSLVMHPK